jgi:hypothetical protein
VSRRAAARLAAISGALYATVGLPAGVAAHSLDSTYQSRLPLAVYLIGAGLAVALSFAFVLLRDLRAQPPAPGTGNRPPPAAVRITLRLIGILGLAWIVAQGIAGGSSVADVASLFVNVYTWVGVALVSALLFPIWHWLDPFSTLHDAGAWVLRRFGVRGWEQADYPSWLGRWPAIAGFVFVVWLELVLQGGQGRTLFVLVIGYTAFTLAMMAQFGRDAWRANGETFSVWFRLLNRTAPFALEDEQGRLRRRPFASGLLEPGWARSDVILIGLATASILFDGLSQTQPWFSVFGAPGAVLKTVQLLAFLGLIVAGALAVSRFVGVAATGAGLLPIAIGYQIAHYLTYLLIDGQYILVAISDPLQRGANLVGTAFFLPNSAFLPPGFVWTIQLVSVVGGHMVGAWAGHVASAREAGRDVRLRQVPLAVIMVFLTTVTLWSLGQAIVRPVDEAASAAEPGAALVAARP